MDFKRFERFEEQVHRARELFLAAPDDARRPELMRILRSAEQALECTRRQIGLETDRAEPQPWWIEWQARHKG